MFLVTILGVIFRYVLSSAPFWTDELARYLMIYMVFWGGTLSFIEGKHPSLTFLIEKLPKRARAYWDLFINLLVFTVLVIIIMGGIEIFFDGIIAKTPGMRISFSIVYAVIPIGSLCMLIQIISGSIDNIKNLTTKKDLEAI